MFVQMWHTHHVDENKRRRMRTKAQKNVCVSGDYFNPLAVFGVRKI